MLNYKSTDFFRIFLCLFLRVRSTQYRQKMLYVAEEQRNNLDTSIIQTFKHFPMAHAYPLTVILLAAGASRRMQMQDGEHRRKIQLSLPNGTTLLQTSLDIYSSVSFAEIIVVVRQQSDMELALPQNTTIKYIINEHAENGMASSLVLGVGNAVMPVQGYLIALSDMPMVQISSIEALCKDFLLQKSAETICVPTFRGARGNPVLLGAAYAADLVQLSGDVGAKSLLRRYAERVREVETGDEGIMLDIDTAEDWQRFLEKESHRTV
jgi:molybdenum cofactor cytidylyltransferase